MVGNDGSAEGLPSKRGVRAYAAEGFGWAGTEGAEAARTLQEALSATLAFLDSAPAEGEAPPALPLGGNAAPRAQDSANPRGAKPPPPRARRDSRAPTRAREREGREARGARETPERPSLAAETSSTPAPSPDVASHADGAADLLRVIYEELRGLRHEVRALQARPPDAPPGQGARAVSIDTARALLGCGRSRVFELLRSGALRRAPKMGKAAMVSAASLEALLEGLHREPVPHPKRKPRARRNAGPQERAAILKLIRRA
jgi:hypothetical protein